MSRAGEDAARGAPPGTRARVFLCGEGRRLVAHYLPDDRLLLHLPDRTARLRRVETIAGTKHASATITFWSKGSAATLTTLEGEQRCVEDPSQSAAEDSALRVPG